MKKIVIAIDSFKDSLTAKQACDIVELAFKNINNNNQYLKLPISDGGEGLTSILTSKTKSFKVTNSIGKLREAKIGILKDTAIIEVSSASGIEGLSKNERNPFNTTSYGTGELIIKALDLGFNKIIIGLGGSSTNDMGIGLLQALGVKLYDKDNQQLGYFGKDIFKIEKIDISNLDQRLNKTKIIIAADVKSPLLGDLGATMMFGSQKGLNKSDKILFENAFIKLSGIINKETKKDYKDFQGAGASGGIGYSLLSFTNSTILPGFDVVSKHFNFQEKLENVDIVITGEGRIDAQTKLGKAPFEIAKLAKKVSPKVKVYALAGIVNDKEKLKVFDDIISINNNNFNIEESIKNAKNNMYNKAYELGKDILF